MIGSALKLLRDELSNYIIANKRSDDAILKEDIILHNIALLDGDGSDKLNDKIVITLVNTEEESTLKNHSNVLRTLTRTQYQRPPVFLNLYILITSTLKENPSADNYEFALHRLALALQFFQAKRKFTLSNSPFATLVTDTHVSDEAKNKLELTVELYTLTFEQINHLWGSLGGKQTPFAMYKIRLIEIQELSSQEAPVIESIRTVETLINADCDE